MSPDKQNPLGFLPRGIAGWTGLEPAASGVTGRRYNQLNYHPMPKSLVGSDSGRTDLLAWAAGVNGCDGNPERVPKPSRALAAAAGKAGLRQRVMLRPGSRAVPAPRRPR